MRIGLLTTSYPRSDDDSAGAFVRGFAEALATRGHSVEVLAPAPSSAGYSVRQRHPRIDLRQVPYALPRRAQQLFYGAGVPENISRRPHLSPLLASFSAALWIAARRRCRSWDAVVSHWALPCGLIASALPRRLPHLAVCHSADVHALTRLPGGAAIRARLQSTAQAMWFVSGAHRARFLSPLGTQPTCYTGPMGFWPLRDRSESAPGSSPPQRLRALTMSRMVPVKGLRYLLHAMHCLPNVDLTVAGDGPCREELQRLAGNLGNVRFVGNVSGEYKRDLLQTTDVFLTPSVTLQGGRSEGVPVALLEAMHCGTPVIASAVGGIPELVTHEEHGLLVPPGDPRALVDALNRIQESPQRARAMGAAGRARASLHTWTSLAPRIEALLRPSITG